MDEDRPPVPVGYRRFEIRLATHMSCATLNEWSNYIPDYVDARIGSRHEAFLADDSKRELVTGIGLTPWVVTTHRKMWRTNTRPFEMKDLDATTLVFVSIYGGHRWRKNGATKFWKTRPNEFRVPVKFGLYQYDYITQDNIKDYEIEL